MQKFEIQVKEAWSQLTDEHEASEQIKAKDTEEATASVTIPPGQEHHKTKQWRKLKFS